MVACQHVANTFNTSYFCFFVLSVSCPYFKECWTYIQYAGEACNACFQWQ